MTEQKKKSYRKPTLQKRDTIKTITQGVIAPTTGPAPAPSDRRLKRNIEYLRTTESGIRLYAFCYLWSETRYVGVIAQELLDDRRFSAAVSQKKNGFYVVDYAMLDMEMLPYSVWLDEQMAAVAG